MYHQGSIQNFFAGSAGKWSTRPSSNQRRYQASPGVAMEDKRYDSQSKNLHLEDFEKSSSLGKQSIQVLKAHRKRLLSLWSS
jgi:hypothetical protein